MTPTGPATGDAARVVVIDNYDSFTWNLVGALRAAGAEVGVFANDDAAGVAAARQADGVLISPGPGRPEDAGISAEVVTDCLAHARPLMGVCLGHQLLAQVLGGRVVRAERPLHGKTSTLAHDGQGLFADQPRHPVVMRYHSLVVAREGLPPELAIAAWDRDSGEIMALRHVSLSAWGVQFHPESILSPHGPRLLTRWLASLWARQLA